MTIPAGISIPIAAVIGRGAPDFDTPSLMQPRDFPTYGSYYEWALETNNFPIRLKFQNPNTLPRRWQTPNR
jgi:hypothetical protein